MVDKRIYEKLKELAQSGKIIHYRELAILLGMPFETSDDRNKLYDKLYEISRFEVKNKRPMLSILVVHEKSFDSSQMPGEGFFHLAKELGVWKGIGKNKFFSDEIRKVWEYWNKQRSTQV